MTTSNLHLTYRDGGTGDAGDPYTGLDRFGHLVETLWKQGDADKVRSKYGRNRLGGVVWRRDEEAHAQSVDTEDNYYWYDALQQVSERQRGDLTGTAPDYTGITSLQQQEGWTYDATGNWAAYSDTSPTNAQTRTHNTANEITQIASAPGNVEPGYDPVGNMLTLPKEPGLSAEQYDLTWDAWNRLVAVKDGETTVASYVYDGLTRRITKTTDAEVRHYYYNAAWRAVEERVDGAATVVDRQYVWGLRGRRDLLLRKRSVSDTLDETLYILRDYLDSVAIVDESGNVVERYAYDAFGAARILAPDFTARVASDYDWNFLFHAEFLDSDTGLYNYGYRYYDTGLGRWLSRDLIKERGGMNAYQMVSNNPCGKTDLLGLMGFVEWHFIPFDEFNGGSNRQKAGDKNVLGDIGGPFAKKCPCFDFQFKFTDARFRINLGGPHVTPFAQLFAQMQIKVTNDKCCNYIRIIQFARFVSLTNNRAPATDSDNRRQERSISKYTSNNPANYGWHLDSTTNRPDQPPDPFAGVPYIDETKNASPFEDEGESTYWDIPGANRNHGFEAYTCLSCSTGSIDTIAGCLKWGFDAVAKGGKIVPTLNPNPFTVTCGPPPANMASEAVTAWNRVEPQKVILK